MEVSPQSLTNSASFILILGLICSVIAGSIVSAKTKDEINISDNKKMTYAIGFSSTCVFLGTWLTWATISMSDAEKALLFY